MAKTKDKKLSKRPFKCLIDNTNPEINQMIEDTYEVINKGRRFFYNLGQNLTAIQLFDDKNETERFAKQFSAWFTLEDPCKYNSEFIIDYKEISNKFNNIAEKEGFDLTNSIQDFLSYIVRPPQKNKVWICRYDASNNFRKQVNLPIKLLELLLQQCNEDKGSRRFFSFFQDGEKANWAGKVALIKNVLKRNLEEYPPCLFDGYDKLHKGAPDTIINAMKSQKLISREHLEEKLIEFEKNVDAYATPKNIKNDFINWIFNQVGMPYDMGQYSVMFSLASSNRKSSRSNYINSIIDIIKMNQDLYEREKKLNQNCKNALENFEIKKYFKKWFKSVDKKESKYSLYLKKYNNINEIIENFINKHDIYSNVQEFIRLVYANNLQDKDVVKYIEYHVAKDDLASRKLASFGNESNMGVNFSDDNNYIDMEYLDVNSYSIGKRNAYFQNVNLKLYNKSTNSFEKRQVKIFNKKLFDNRRDLLFEKRFDGMTNEEKKKFQDRKGGRLDIVDGKYYLTINYDVDNNEIKKQFDFKDVSLVISCDLGQKKAAAVSAMLWSTDYFESAIPRELSFRGTNYLFYVKELDYDFIKFPSYFHNEIQSEDLLTEKGYILSNEEKTELGNILNSVSAESLDEQYSASAFFKVSNKLRIYVCNNKTNKYADIMAKYRNTIKLYNILFRKNNNELRKSVAGLSYERIKCLENISRSLASIVRQCENFEDDKLADIIKDCKEKHDFVLNKKKNVVAERSKLISNAIVDFAVDVKDRFNLSAGTKIFLAAEKIDINNEKGKNSKASRKNNINWDVKRLSKYLNYACENYGINYENVLPSWSSHINYKTMKSCDSYKDSNSLFARMNKYDIKDLDLVKIRRTYEKQCEDKDHYLNEWERLFDFFDCKDINHFVKTIKSCKGQIYIPEKYGDYIRVEGESYSLNPKDYINSDLNAAKVIGYRFLGNYMYAISNDKKKTKKAS